ncbi:mechanosensitive ion channel [Candidatus Poribacteria bacterium]|nr:mechanosensitive ion channel [Candidatus Poribacteria bacterium]
MEILLSQIHEILNRTVLTLDEEVKVEQIVRLIGFVAVWLLGTTIFRRWLRRVISKLKLTDNLQNRIIAILFLITLILGIGFAFRFSEININIFDKVFRYDLVNLFKSSEDSTDTISSEDSTDTVKSGLEQPTLTLANIFYGFAIIFGIFVLSKYTQWLLQNQVLQAFQIERHTQFIILRIIHFIMITIGVLISLRTIGMNFTNLAIIFGGLSIGIGFGLQNTVANLISGFILIFERPIKIGDLVEIIDVNIFGRVTSINLRSTVIMSLDEKEIIVPNSKLITEPVHNLTHYNNRFRIRIQVGVSYSSDVNLVKTALLEAASEHEMVIKDPTPQMENVTPPFVRFTSFGDSSLDFELLAWIPDSFMRFDVASDLHFMVWEKLEKYGIKIPFPQRDVHIYQEEKKTSD